MWSPFGAPLLYLSAEALLVEVRLVDEASVTAATGNYLGFVFIVPVTVCCAAAGQPWRCAAARVGQERSFVAALSPARVRRPRARRDSKRARRDSLASDTSRGADAMPRTVTSYTPSPRVIARRIVVRVIPKI